MGLFTKPSAKMIQVLAKVFQTKQGDSATVVFENLNNVNLPSNLKTVAPAYFSDRTPDDGALPQGVDFEIWISESLLDASEFAGFSSIRQEAASGTRRWGVAAGYPLPPLGANRFWRFGVSPKEDAQ